MAIQIIGTRGGEQVIVTIDGANTTIETQGFQGRACQSATAGLELALGLKRTDEPTAEMWDPLAAHQVKQ